MRCEHRAGSGRRCRQEYKPINPTEIVDYSAGMLTTAPPSPARLAPAALARLVRRVARSLHDGTQAIELPVGTRRYCRLRETAEHDLWVIVWGPESGVDFHDHGGSTGAFCVVRGELAETTLTPEGFRTRTLAADGHAQLEADTRHRVENRSATAVSVHAYSLPLSAMNFFGGAGDWVRAEAVT
jgi:hypothetical protein